jgi:hypothetical protein
MKAKIVLSIWLFLTLILSSCLFVSTPTPQPTVDKSSLAQLVAQAIETQFAQQTANAPSNTLTLTPTPTQTPSPTLTPTFTNTPTQSLIPVYPTILCNSAAFIQDISVPDGSQFSPGDLFTKTWRFQNTGSCTWTPAYQVVFDHGDLLGAPSAFGMPAYVNPGQIVDISMNMQAPNNPGIYEGFWRFMAPNGTTFGIGLTASADFDIQIVVGSLTPVFEVRHVTMSVDTSSVTTTCPPGYTFTISAVIITNGPGDVTYVWEFSDGSNSGPTTIHIDGSQTQTVSITFAANGAATYWARVRIDSPNNITSEKIHFTLTCPPPAPTTPILTNTEGPTRTPRTTGEPTRAPRPTGEPTRTPRPTT